MTTPEARQLGDEAEQSPLARYRGERPPAAAWFQRALAIAPERSTFDVAGTPIELLTWGEIGKPGLLFLHGNGAHAGWWEFIAPFFAGTHRCAAISWSGMGGSGWRESYSIAAFADEVLGAIDAAQLDRAGKPMLIAHSFGGSPAMVVGANHADRIAGIILIDSFVIRTGPGPRWTSTGAPTRRYATVEEILARYRYAPLQPCDHPEITDHIARGSIRHVDAEGDLPAGWTWRFDPGLWANMDRAGMPEIVARVSVPVALLFGEDSGLVNAESVANMQSLLADCPIAISIPHARHHVMVDQPIALVSALRVTVQALAVLEERR